MSRVRSGVIVVAVAVAAFVVGRSTAPQQTVVERAEVPKPEPSSDVWTVRFHHSRAVPLPEPNRAPPPYVQPEARPVSLSALRIINDATGEAAAETTTDENGRFRVTLPPGRYHFDNPQDHTRLGGQVFEVRSGEYTRYVIDENVPTT